MTGVLAWIDILQFFFLVCSNYARYLIGNFESLCTDNGETKSIDHIYILKVCLLRFFIIDSILYPILINVFYLVRCRGKIEILTCNQPALLIMWYPNSVLIGSSVISPFLSLNAASSNGFTIMPLPNNPKSPPRFALPLSIDSCLARFEKLSPFLRRSNINTASHCFLTSMWEHLILSVNVLGFFPH